MGIVQRDGLKLTIVSYIGVILGYVNKVVLLPNLFKPEEVGLANLLVSLAAIYAQFSALGSVGIILKFFPFFRDKEKKHHGFLSWCMILMSVGFILFTIAFVLLRPWVAEHYSQNSKLFVDYYYYLIPLGLATVCFQVFDSYLRSLLKTVVPSFLNEVFVRIMVTLSISLYAFKIVDFHGFVWVYVGLNCSIALVIIVYTMFLNQFFVWPRFGARLKRYSKYMLYFGMFSILSSAGNVFIANIDALMVTRYIDLGATGIYTTVFFFSTVMLIPYRSVLKITSPLVAQHWKNKNMIEMEKLYKQVTLVCLTIGLYIFLGLWLNIDSVFYFMPTDYAAGKYVFLFVALGRLFDMATGLNGVIMITSKKYRYDLFFTFFLIFLTVVNNYFFIVTLHMGMNGAALATFITLVIYNILRLIFVKYHFNIQPFEKSCIWITILGVLVYIVIAMVPFVWNVYIDVIIRSLLVTVLYIFPVLYFRLAPDLNDFLKKFSGNFPVLRLIVR